MSVDLPLDQEKSAPQTLAEYLESNKTEIAKALPAGVSVDDFIRLAMTEARSTAGLLKCTYRSYLACLMVTAQLGFEPGPLEHVHFVPRDINVGTKDAPKYEKQATFQVGYKGWLDLMRRHPDVIDIEAHCVREQDQFSYSFGSGRHLTHEPSLADDRGDIIGAYAFGRLRSGAEIYDYWTVSKIRDHAETFSQTQQFWSQFFEQMARKTMLLAIKAWMPKSSIVERAAQVDGTTPTIVAPDSLLGAGSTGDEPIHVPRPPETAPDTSAVGG